MSNTRYKGFGEGHLAPILRDIVQDVRQHRVDGVGARVPGNGLYALREHVFIRFLFHGYERYLVSMLGSEYILDKTPTIDPIRLAPDFNRFHEAPRFIHCSRRHVDNIQSKLKKFPDRSLRQHCEEWAACNLAWLEAKQRLEGNFIDFDFYDLATDPTGTSQKIADYLGLDAKETDEVSSYLISQRPQSTQERDLTNFLRLSELNWTDEQKEDFLLVCGPVGERLGYDTEEYFLEGNRAGTVSSDENAA